MPEGTVNKEEESEADTFLQWVRVLDGFNVFVIIGKGKKTVFDV